MGADEVMHLVYNQTQQLMYSTIQDAIDDANNGDTITVYPGTYYESIDFNGTSVTVRGWDPNDWDIVEETIIDANGATYGAKFYSSADATLVGVTIKNANNYGVWCTTSSDPNINRCIIENDVSGVYASGTGPTIVNNKIRDNSNSGVVALGSVSQEIKNNWIYGNGRGIYISGTNKVIRNNTIVDSTISGIEVVSGSATISNCIVWDCNDELNGCTATYSCISDCNDANGLGNICGDANAPNFVDPNNGDYHIASDSLCIDAADPNGDYEGETDMERDRRYVGGTADMGGDEYFGPYNVTRDQFYPTIQAAVDDAATGDEIVVYPGVYTGDGNRDIDFGGKAITLRGEDPNDSDVVAATVIDCQGTLGDPHRGFHFHSGEEANSLVNGLTVKNGLAPVGDVHTFDYAGGAIFCDNSSPRIANCIICETCLLHPPFASAYGSKSMGAGIACYNGACPKIDNCIISDNLAEGISSISIRNGGGIGCYNGANAEITNCLITGNSARDGGGISFNASSPTVRNCIISSNFAYDGGGIHCENASDPTLSGCTFSKNSANAQGGALSVYTDSDPDIRNSIFCGNSALGGGAIVVQDTNPTVSGCTFSKNEAGYYGGAIYNAGSSSPDVNNCILWDNTADVSGDNYYGNWTITYSDVGGGASGTGNIDADPCFVDPDANDFHLGPNSPCIEAGDPNGDYSGQSDIDAEDRVMDGDADCNEVVDMGADEAYGPDCWNCGTQCYGDADCDSDVDFGDLSILNAAFGTEYGDPNYNACADFDKDGDINFGELFTLTTNFGPPDPNSDCDCGGTWPPE